MKLLTRDKTLFDLVRSANCSFLMRLSRSGQVTIVISVKYLSKSYLPAFFALSSRG